MNKGLLYLACPYTDKNHYVMVARHILVNKVAAHLMSLGFYIFSPISHTHPIAEASEGKLPRGWDYWEGYDTTIIKHCEKMIVLMLPGWETSKGVQAEIEIAKNLGIPIEYRPYQPFGEIAIIIKNEMAKELAETRKMGQDSTAKDKTSVSSYSNEGVCLGTTNVCTCGNYLLPGFQI